MAVIGNIVIGMGVGLDGLSKGLGQAKAKVTSFAGSVQTIAPKLAGVGQAASGAGSKLLGLAAAGVTAFAGFKAVEFAKGALQSADAVADMATQIGTSAGALQSLRYVAKLTGSETEALDGAIQKMTVVLGDAAQQGGPAAKTISKLGLDAKKLSEQDPAQSFREIAAAISKIENPTLQASAAVDLFGRGSTALLNTLRAGPEEFARLSAEAERFGLSLNAADAAKIAAANDAMDRLGFAVSGLGNSLAVVVAPAFTKVLNLAVDWGASAVAAIGPVVTSYADLVSSIYESVVPSAYAAFEAIKGPAEALRDGIKSAVDYVAWGVRNLGSIWRIAQIRVTEFCANVIVRVETMAENFVRVVKWIGRNWREMLADFASYQITVFTNLLDNAGAFGTALWDAIQGKGFKFDWKPLTEGFKATTESMPKMLKPALVSLQDEIDAEGKKIFERETARAAEAARAAQAGAEKVKAAAPGDSGDQGPRFAKAAELGSKEAYSAIIKFQSRDRGDDAPKRTAKAAEESLKVQRDQLAEMRKRPAAASPSVFAFGG